MTTIGKLGETKVGDLMTRHVVMVMADDTIQDVASLLADHGLSTIPVVNSHDKCIGVISRKDLTEMFLEEDEELSRVLDTDRLSLEWFNRTLETTDHRKVKELMNDRVSVISMESSLTNACREMARNRIHHLPVVDENEKLIGMLSTFDIVNAIAHVEE